MRLLDLSWDTTPSFGTPTTVYNKSASWNPSKKDFSLFVRRVHWTERFTLPSYADSCRCLKINILSDRREIAGVSGLSNALLMEK